MLVFISQPMKGLQPEQIEWRRARAVELLELAGHKVANPGLGEKPEGRSTALNCLAGALAAMSQCDGAYFMKGWEDARGCRIEHAAATEYGLWVMQE